MATTKEALVIILDVGKSTKQQNNASKQSFFERAKMCTEKILQRKIFSQPKDEVGLILMGADKTHNHLNTTLDGYENIVEAFDLALTNWQMLQVLDKEISQNKSDADWLDAIIVAMDFMKNQIEGKKFSTRKICLLTTFSTAADDDRVDAIISGLQAMEIQLIVITDNIEFIRRTNEDDSDDEEAVFSQTVSKTQQQRSSEELITKIIKETNGALSDFNQALFQLIYFEKKKQRSMPWHCQLEIGSRLRINVSTYIYIKDTSSMSPWKTYGPNGPCKTETKYYLDEIPLKPEDVEKIIRGYMYGSTPVPFDKSLGLSFNSGEKCLICIGFTNISLLHDEHFTGSGIWTVVPKTGCTVSGKMFAAMVSVMRQSNLAMIVRYVYRTGLKAKMMALFPNKLSDGRDNFRDSSSLSMMEIFFADNHNYTSFPSLKTRKNQPTDEQYEAVDQLIDSMDLMNAYDHEAGSNEAFACKKILNPTLQYTYRTIAHRAMYPTLPIPKPEQDLLDLLNVPEKIKRNSEQPLAKVKSLFPLEIIVKATKADLYKKMGQISSVPDDDGTGTSAAAAIQLPNNDDDDSAAIVEIGTITPAEDLLDLLRRGERFSTLCTQIQNVISDLIFKSIATQDEKLLKAIVTYRLQAIELGAYRYNEWITEFKDILLKRNKVQIWQSVIVAERLGLILEKESEISTVSEEEGRAFYTDGIADGGANVTGADAAEDDNLDDLLDNI